MKTKWLLPLALLCVVLGGGIIGCESSDDDKEDEEAEAMTLTLIDTVTVSNKQTISLTYDKSSKTYKIPEEKKGFYEKTSSEKDDDGEGESDSSTTGGIPTDTTEKSFAGWYDANKNLYTKEKLNAGFAYAENGYTLIARYNDIKTPDKATAGNLLAYNSDDTTIAPFIIDKQYEYASYTTMNDTVKICGIVLDYGKHYGETYTAASGSTDASFEEKLKDAENLLILGTYAGSDLAWRGTDAIATGLAIPDAATIVKHQDNTGIGNNEIAQSLFSDTLEIFEWAEKYNSTYKLPDDLANKTWYLPSEIEFDTYLANKLSAYLDIISSLGNTALPSGIDFWTASLDKLNETKYLPCYYSTNTKNFASASPSEKKYALAICQYTPDSSASSGGTGSGGNGD